DSVVAHLTEPESVAVDSVVSVSQAIRREIAAVGDGIERAIARASELELLVQREVSSLERSYRHNALRLRSVSEERAGRRQAIRREIAAVGDGIERAIARASELELLVQSEVSSLERSSSDNELRMRSLIEDLAGQREAILVNSERVRTSIVRAQESLSEDL